MKYAVDYRLIGGRIREKRKQNHLTQERLAEDLGVSVGYVSQVERGVTKISLELLSAVASLLSCDPGELITGSATASEAYLRTELLEQVSRLTDREKRLVLSFVRWLAENRETP